MMKIKEWVIKSGLPSSFRVEMLNVLLEIGRWLKDHPFPVAFESRFDLYRYLNEEIVRNGPIDYLEFGVWKGESIKHWSELNRHPDSRFFGFDSFEGLPEEWRFFAEVLPKGSFDAKGEKPKFNDPRVKYFKGLFQDILPDFLKTFAANHRLIINCDADLYSSTFYLLASMNSLLKPGSIVILDEITTIDEFKAFRDFTQAFMRKYRLLAAAERLFYLRVAIEVA